MGIFKKLYGALDKIEDVKNVIEKAADSIQKSSVVQNDIAASAPVRSASVPFKTYNTDDSYFDSLITEASFPGYAVTKNVSAKTFDAAAHPSCYPISYLFSKNSKPVLAVFVMNKNQYRSMIARGTYKVLDDCGVTYIRFFKGMENERGYVLNRIRENLK